GDFVVRRADGIVAYHLAVAVDDAAQGVTEVVRGADLLDSTPRQLLVLDALGLARPGYAHLPVAVHAGGAKLSKQTNAPALSAYLGGRDGGLQKARVVAQVLAFLGHRPPADSIQDGIASLWDWAVRSWRLERVPRQAAALAPVADEYAR
ncbi:MAG: glutamate--tRNA ligase family protein, partial [Gammaproteobacteria bacterium]